MIVSVQWRKGDDSHIGAASSVTKIVVRDGELLLYQLKLDIWRFQLSDSTLSKLARPDLQNKGADGRLLLVPRW